MLVIFLLVVYNIASLLNITFLCRQTVFRDLSFSWVEYLEQEVQLGQWMWTENRKKRKIENEEITKLNLKEKWMTIKKTGENCSWEGRKATKKIRDENVSSRVRSGGGVGGRQGAGEPRAGVRVGGAQTGVRRSPPWPAGLVRGGPLRRTALNLQVQQLPLCEIIKRREVKARCSKDGEQQAEPGLANHSIGLQPRMILWPLFRESGHIPGPTTKRRLCGSQFLWHQDSPALGI